MGPLADLGAVVNRNTQLVLALVSVPLVIAMAALFGHYAGVQVLLSVWPEFRAMSTLTATCIALLAVGMAGVAFDRELLGAAAGVCALALASTALASHAVHGVDLVSSWWSTHVLYLPPDPGHTSRSTASAVVCLAIVLLVRDRPQFVDFSAVIALMLSTVALLGYAYGVSDLYALSLFNHMALNTAAALFILSVAALCLRPDTGWSAVVAARDEIGGATRSQLLFCALPPIVGWFVVRALNLHQIGVGAAMALFVAATILPLALLILRDGKRLLDEVQAQRARDNELAAAAARAQVLLAEQASRLRTESAERAKAEASVNRAQRLDAIGQLTGGIAHDFNNLLMVIGGNVQLLRRRMLADDPLRRFVDGVAAAVAKGSKVTQQLLAFSRSQRLDIKPTSVGTVVAEAREMIGSSLGPTVQIDLRIETGGGWALCDADQLELSLINLAVNARDAMPDGGRLTVTCVLGALTQSPRQGQPCILVEVTDTGTGMDADVAAHAGEPFFTTKDRGHGTGLGLAQVHGFVAQCKGELQIITAPGQGTTVQMRFPVVEAPAPQRVGEPAAAAPSGGVTETRKQVRVMVIDDDDGVREVIVEALTDAGYDVAAAIDGLSGLEKMVSFRPAAAVIDFIMPGMHGADVARAAQARYPGLPIIFVSGYSDTAVLEGVSGASVLRKPFEVSTLTRMVEMAVAD